MKFLILKKETKDRKYHEDPFRAVNFRIDEQGVMRCPNDKAFHLLYRRSVRGNQYGRKEELYECEDCSRCSYAEKCKKTDKNRTVRINQELTVMHQEVIENLESIHGALLRMNRSIQAEGTLGIMKNDRWYKKIVRRGINSVKIEVLLVEIGHNLYKYQNKKRDAKKLNRVFYIPPFLTLYYSVSINSRNSSALSGCFELLTTMSHAGTSSDSIYLELRTSIATGIFSSVSSSPKSL